MKGLTWPGYEGERRQIPGVPTPLGGYGPGVVLPLCESGLSEDEALTRIAGTPLELVEIPEPQSGSEPDGEAPANRGTRAAKGGSR